MLFLHDNEEIADTTFALILDQTYDHASVNDKLCIHKKFSYSHICHGNQYVHLLIVFDI